MEGTRRKSYYEGFVVGVFVFFFGCWQSCDYVRLKYFGEVAQAPVTGFHEIGEESDKHCVKHPWTMGDGTAVRGHDTIAVDWEPPESGTVKICYLPNAKIPESTRKSQLVEKSATFPLMIVWMGVFLMVGCGMVAYFMERET